MKTLYWKGIVVKNFKDEQAVERVMRENAPTSGVYVMPSVKDPESISEKLPIVFTGINLKGKRPLLLVLIGGLISKIGLAFLGSWLLVHHDTKMPYRKRVGFFVIIGVIVAVSSKLSFLVKGYYSIDFALYSMFAVLLQWFVAGLVMGRIIKHR